MEPRTEEDEANNELAPERREYSSPACLLHEFERRPNGAVDPGDALTIYHNPACSKSRETLALIQASGLTPRVIEYLKTPPSRTELMAIVSKLGITPAQLVRRGEPVFEQKYTGKILDDTQWLDALAADPILMQRPIVVRGNEAVIGRPPENAKRLLV